MEKNNFKKAFTLTEVLISTIVMSMIMGSVLAFVQYAGDIWHKGSEKIASNNYSRMAFELIKQDLMQARQVTLPSQPGKFSKKLIYYKEGFANKFKIEIASGTLASDTLIRTGIIPSEGVDNTGSATMHLARNVKYFGVRRISQKTFEITLQIKREQSEDELLEGEEPEIISSETMILIAPGA